MAEETLTEELTQSEMDELDKLAYTHKRYLTPKEIAAYVLVNFGQKNLSQFVDAFKEFFMIQFLKLNSTAYANINLFASVYDALDDTISGLIIDRTRTRWGRIRPFFIICSYCFSVTCSNLTFPLGGANDFTLDVCFITSS